jgi:hypothetical protein
VIFKYLDSKPAASGHFTPNEPDRYVNVELSPDRRELSATFTDPELATATYRCVQVGSEDGTPNNGFDLFAPFYMGLDEPAPGTDTRSLTQLPACAALSPDSTPTYALSGPTTIASGRDATYSLASDDGRPASAVAAVTMQSGRLRLSSPLPTPRGEWTVRGATGTVGQITTAWEDPLIFGRGDERPVRCSRLTARPISVTIGRPPVVRVAEDLDSVRFSVRVPNDCTAAGTGQIQLILAAERKRTLTLSDQCGKWKRLRVQHLATWKIAPHNKTTYDPTNAAVQVTGSPNRTRRLSFRAMWRGKPLLRGVLKGKIVDVAGTRFTWYHVRRGGRWVSLPFAAP